MKQQHKILDKSFDINKIKSQSSELFIGLRSIIDFYDPVDLSKYGIEDEYDSETASILVQLNKNLNQEQLLELVYQEFKYWFDPIAGKKENYENLSEAIYNWMKSVSL